MDVFTLFIDISPEGLRWLLLAAGFLLAAMVVSTCRRMLEVFSRKALLEEAREDQRARLEELLHRVDGYAAALRAIDHCLRLCLVASIAFATLSRRAAPGGAQGEVLGFILFVGSLISIMFFFLELLPSIFSRVRPEGAVRLLLPLLDRMYMVLRPLGRLFGSLVRAGARVVGGEEERPSAAVVEEEILTAVEEGEREGILQEDDASMIESIIRFQDKQVSEVMTPRTEMVCIDIAESVEESVRIALECGHSRIPVYRENKDNIAGILYVKDLLRFWNREKSGEVRLSDIIRQAHFVPESKKISELFNEFRSQRFHIAIILDEFGGTAGLITIEDIIEEIVGEIADEFEKEERPEFQRIGEDLVELNARLPILELNEKLGIDLPEDDGYDTVGGFLFSSMGRIPSVGESYEHGRARFEVIEADDRKVNRLRIHIRNSVPPEEGEGEVEGRTAEAREAGKKE